MNLFVVHQNPAIAALALSDQHVPKMILETAQILDGGTRPIMNDLYPRKRHTIVGIPPSHRDNPCILSAGSRIVWRYAFDHLVGLLAEFEYRFGHKHAYAKDGLMSALTERGKLASPGMTDRGFRLCMPGVHKTTRDTFASIADAVVSYRRYYVAEKAKFGALDRPSTWRLRAPPPWLDRAQEASGYRRLLTPDGRRYYYAHPIEKVLPA